MRIISGLMRGTKLYTLEGDNTRPTLDRVKEALFSKINFDLEDSLVLDLFSGSGALALESISRGARHAYMCDSSREAIKIIEQNVEKTHAKDKVTIMNTDYKNALGHFIKDKIVFDIVFLDPPYMTDYGEHAAKIIMENNLIDDNGFIVLETDDKDRVINNLDDDLIQITDIKKYGRVFLLFLSRKG